MSFSPILSQLIDALRCLPSVGPKSAQRMAFHLLERDRTKAVLLAKIIQQAIECIGHCQLCRIFSENALCNICANPQRDSSQLCILETPADVLAIEQSGSYKGRYFVLFGHLSPIDGIGPEEIGINSLLQHLDTGEIKEVILATNPTVEGEVTAHYIATLSKQRQIKTSRIAYGVPMGGELEFIDSSTLARALAGRGELL
ncbi:recombination mediator RecR [soil metagenome]